MPFSAAPALALVLLAWSWHSAPSGQGSACAQTTNVTCGANFTWMDNGAGNNPCFVTANLLQACVTNGTKINVPPLPPHVQGYSFPGSGLDANECTCTSVTYSTLSACSACQGGQYPKWSVWSAACPEPDISVAKLPSDLQIDVPIPSWAFDSPTDLDGFDINAAHTKADAASLNAPLPSPTPSGPSSPAAPAPSSSETALSASVHSSPPIAAIVGGVVGGLVAIGLCVLGIILLRRRPRDEPQHARPATPSVSGWTMSSGVPATQPTITSPNTMRSMRSMQSQLVVPSSPGSLGSRRRLYDPDDPSTFPPSAAQIAGQAPGARAVPEL